MNKLCIYLFFEGGHFLFLDSYDFLFLLHLDLNPVYAFEYSILDALNTTNIKFQTAELYLKRKRYFMRRLFI